MTSRTFSEGPMSGSPKCEGQAGGTPTMFPELFDLKGGGFVVGELEVKLKP